MNSLFDAKPETLYKPLADRLRPVTIDDIVGQNHLLGKNKPLRLAIESGNIPSVIFWGPPGSGKTSIASIIAKSVDAEFYWFSAVLSGVKELRQIIDTAKKMRRMNGKKTILFVDEIHRFNKAQQDAFLPHVEDGTVILVGATTENPSFEVISPLLSRAKVYTLNPLNEDDLKILLKKGLKNLQITLTENAEKFIISSADGDARRLFNTIEQIFTTLPKEKIDKNITLDNIESILQKRSLIYDKGGEEHYNVISAFIKSMRGSDPNAAVYWLARMLESGEDPLFIARRMVIFASEDIGNADPQAIQVAISCMQSFQFVGLPEGWIPLAQAATYLATAPKSKAAYKAYKYALKDIKEHGTLKVPMHIRNAPTKLMKNLGYGKDYKDPHQYENNVINQQYLPDKIIKATYYKPTQNGYEKQITIRLKQTKDQRPETED